MNAPRHTSLQAAWTAAMPPPRVAWLTRLRWRLTWKLLSLRPVQRIFERRYGS